MSTTAREGPVQRPIRVLSLDGGGVRGKSSLLILENIMETLRDAENLDEVPRPCDWFDLIGGTSTGGIIAILLGRLGMSVHECINAYDDIAQHAFIPKKRIMKLPDPKGRFSATALEATIKEFLRRKFCTGGCPTKNCEHEMMEYRDFSCTKTVVLTTTKANVDVLPTLLTTYDTSTRLQGCQIWEVVRATSAATTFFKSIKLGRDQIEYIDSGFGHNNPCELLIQEAEKQFPSREMRIVSIGTGLSNVINIDNTHLSILKALKKMATSSHLVASRLENRLGDSGAYFRFNVERGLQDITLSDWEQMSTISSHTSNYLGEKERNIRKCAESLRESIRPFPVPEIRETKPPTENKKSRICDIPISENPNFIPRQEAFKKLQEMMFHKPHPQRIALVGLGGAGKTQIALNFAHWIEKSRPDFNILWTSALSDASYEQACSRILKKWSLPTLDDESAKVSLCHYLQAEESKNWLLVVDNADDKNVLLKSSGGLIQYLPNNKHVHILFTTRTQEIATNSCGRWTINVESMSKVEARDCLRASLVTEIDIDDQCLVDELLETLTFLPLAIVQAASFMNMNSTPIQRYLRICRDPKQGTIRLLAEKFHDAAYYNNTPVAVATTWFISFDAIQRYHKRSAEILSFLSHIEPNAIPRSILPELRNEELTEGSIGVLCGYSFLRERKEKELYDMHSLVHQSLKLWAIDNPSEESLMQAVNHLGNVVPHPQEWEHRELWQQYLPHVLRALEEAKTNSGIDSSFLGLRVGFFVREEGRTAKAVQLLEHVVAIRAKLAEDHPDRLVSQHTLASAYKSNGQIKEAVQLLEHVVAIQAKLAEDHPSRLASQHQLTSAYISNGQIKKAVQLLEHVVAIRAKLAEDHPSRLASQHMLASAYKSNGQIKEAVQLLKHVVAIREIKLAEDHPDRLASQHNLASAYKSNGQIKKAVQLLEHIVAIQVKLAEDHPDRLASQHTLASAYKSNGQIKEAVRLLEYVVAIREVKLAEDHPNRLASQHNLASAYISNGQIKEAVQLLEHVITIREVKLAEDHPDRLASQHTLASAYESNGQIKEAVQLLEHVVAIREAKLAEDHPERIVSERLLRYILNKHGHSGHSGQLS